MPPTAWTTPSEVSNSVAKSVISSNLLSSLSPNFGLDFVHSAVPRSFRASKRSYGTAELEFQPGSVSSAQPFSIPLFNAPVGSHCPWGFSPTFLSKTYNNPVVLDTTKYRILTETKLTWPKCFICSGNLTQAYSQALSNALLILYALLKKTGLG